jgi:lysophospholipase L1-like esterase
MLRLTLLLAFGISSLTARETQPRPESVPADYVGHLAPEPQGLILKKGDRYAICGDSITEQKMYSRILEAYLTAARPDLEIECRQYGWSGETAGGFYGRMKNDVLRFNPTIASTCYGMNDFHYVPFTDAVGAEYRKNQTQVVQLFKNAGARVVLGSSGTIHSVPPWVKSARGTWETLNLALLQLRNIDIEIAEAEQVTFADVYWPMLLQGREARAKYGEGFKLEGNDGVHPGWAGHVMMASAYLKALGLDGDLGMLTLDLANNTAFGVNGQKIDVLSAGVYQVKSQRLPFTYDAGEVSKDSSIAAGVALANFHQRFNRLTLKAVNFRSAFVKVTWGEASKVFTAVQLKEGVNLAAEFPQGPLKPAFDKIWTAVGEKQAYETKQIKSLLHSKEAKADMEGVVKNSEVEHARLVANLKAAYAPAESTLRLELVK